MTTKVRSGYVTLMGLPNAGKSSFLNRLVGEELAIVSPKAQTTWQNMRGFYVKEGMELVLIDTPGIQEGTKALNAAISRNAIRAVSLAKDGHDIVALVVDAIDTFKTIHEKKPNPLLAIVKVLERDGFKLPLALPLIVTINKADLLKRPDDRRAVETLVQATAAQISKELIGIHWVSSKLEAGFSEWVARVQEHLPVDTSGKLFDKDTISDRNLRDFVSEFIREQCFYQLGEELPYSIAVQIEKFEESDPRHTHIEAVIHVEKESQKPIVIGKGGEKIKASGSAWPSGGPS